METLGKLDTGSAEELSNRELLLKAHEIACETLRLFSIHFNQRLPLEGMPGARLNI
jgi:hypothetical protein